MKFTAKGYLKTKNSNTVEVEGVNYWVSGQDLLKVAKTAGLATEGLLCSEYGIDGMQVPVVVHRDENGSWAEIRFDVNEN